MSQHPKEELQELLREYICTPRIQLCLSKLQSLLNQVPDEQRLHILKQRVGSYKYTPLHCAAVRSHPEILETILNYVIPVKRYELLEVQDNVGQTALHRAAMGDNISSINCMLSCLMMSQLHMELLKLKDLDGKTAIDRAIHFNRIRAATVLQKWHRVLGGRIEKRKILPKDSAEDTVVDGLWVLELVCQQQEVKFGKLKADHDELLLSKQSCPPTKLQEKRGEISDLEENLKVTAQKIIEYRNTLSEISNDTEPSKKIMLSNQLEAIEQRHKKIFKDLEVFKRQLDMFEILNRQTFQITDLKQRLDEKDLQLQEQRVKINKIEATQTSEGKAVAAVVTELQTTQQSHGHRINGAEEKIEYLQLPTGGDQPLDSEPIVTFCAQPETGQ